MIVAITLTFAMTLVCPLVGWAQSIGKARGPDRCSEKLKLDKLEDFERLAIDSKLDKIIHELQFSPKEFDRIRTFRETRDLAAQSYGLGFLVSSKGQKAAQDAKAYWLNKWHGSRKTWEAEINQLPPQEQIAAQAWLSKFVSLMSKAFDLGREDGGKPCPELRKPI